MSRLFWRIPITRYTCDIHGVPVVWRVTSSYINPGVEFTIRYWSQGALIYKDFTISLNHWNGAYTPPLRTLMTTTWLKISLIGWQTVPKPFVNSDHDITPAHDIKILITLINRATFHEYSQKKNNNRTHPNKKKTTLFN